MWHAPVARLREAERIKELVDLVAVMRLDGHRLFRAGSQLVCLSPFKPEKTPSCYVDPVKQVFFDFSTGKAGDVFSYVQTRDGCSFKEAIVKLAGGDPAVLGRRRGPLVQVDATAALRPMAQAHAEEWREGCRFLAGSLKHQVRIAEWRGFKPETVRAFAAAGLMGKVDHSGERREAFLVEAPVDGKRTAVGYHTLLRKPDGSKIFYYVPKGIGAWPFVIGCDPGAADALMLLEGQWDAIAFCEACEWGAAPPPRVSVVGLRGAHTWKRFMEHYPPRKGAVVFMFADDDAAGLAWFDEGGFADRLEGSARAVHRHYWEGVKDFNDAHRVGLSGLVEYMRSKIGAKRKR